MPSKFDSIARWSVKLGIAGIAKFLLRNQLLVLTYHRIRSDSLQRFMFDDEAFSCTASQFDEQVQQLLRHRCIVGIDDVVEAFRGKPLPENATLITFDDGAADNYEIAYPILRKHGATAVFFVPTLMLKTRSTGWWDNIAYLLKSSAPGTYQVPIAGQTVPVDVTSPSQAANSIKAVQSRVKSLASLDYEQLLANLAKITGGKMPNAGEQSSQIVTEEQLKEMASHGMSIGGHSHTHRILSQLSIDEQRYELGESKAILESIIKGPVLSLAYPVGGAGHYTRDTQALARELGYQCAFNFRFPGGFARMPNVDRFDIPRISASDESEYSFLAQISGITRSSLGLM